MQNKRTIGSLIAILFNTLLFLNIATAAEPDTPTDKDIAETWIMHVNANDSQKFEAALKSHSTYRNSKGESREWFAYTPYVGSNLNYYIIRTCCVNWSDIDEYNTWASTAELGQHWATTAGQYVTKTEHYFGKIDMDNSNWKTNPNYKYIGLTQFTPKTGAEEKFRNTIKKISTIAKDGEWPRTWAWVSRIGGKGGIHLASPMVGLSEMKPEMPFEKFLAEQLRSDKKAKAMLKEFDQSIESSSYNIFTYRPDLIEKK